LFLSLGLDSLFAIYPLRSLRQPFWKLPAVQNPQLLLAVGLGLALLAAPLALPALQGIFGFAGLRLLDIVLVAAITCGKVMLIELGKAWFLADVRRPKQVLLS
jgi:hypothetical protein